MSVVVTQLYKFNKYQRSSAALTLYEKLINISN